MSHAPNFILSRIHWCRRLRTQVCTQPEMDGWRAEEQGLRDALLKRDHTKLYQCYPSGVFERYAMGLEDGQALIRLSGVHRHVARSRS
jgi:hypothetical protein